MYIIKSTAFYYVHIYIIIYIYNIYIYIFIFKKDCFCFFLEYLILWLKKQHESLP